MVLTVLQRSAVRALFSLTHCLQSVARLTWPVRPVRKESPPSSNT